MKEKIKISSSFVVGLTGNIGTGKTVVTKLFADLGIKIIDADILARNILNNNKKIINKITSYLGNNVLKDDKTLDRLQLRNIIFSDTKKRLWLNNLLHPLIEKDLIKAAANYNENYILVVAPLLLEAGWLKFIDYLILICADKNIITQRVTKRDACSADEVSRILDAQMSNEQKSLHADFVLINNNSDIIELKLQIDKLHKYFLSITNINNT